MSNAAQVFHKDYSLAVYTICMEVVNVFLVTISRPKPSKSSNFVIFRIISRCKSTPAYPLGYNWISIIYFFVEYLAHID